LNDNHVTVDQGVLYLKPLPYPTAVTGDPLTGRDSNQIFVKGFKMRRQFYMIVRDANPVFYSPQVVNYCLVQPTSWAITEDIQSQNDNRVERALTGEMFTDYSGSTGQTRAWTNNTQSVSAWRYEKNHLPLNSRNNFKIITHTRRVLHPAAAGTISALSKKMDGPLTAWTFKKWMRYNKTVEFDVVQNTIPKMPIYEMWWYEAHTPFGYNIIAPPARLMYTTSNHECYFQNIP